MKLILQIGLGLGLAGSLILLTYFAAPILVQQSLEFRKHEQQNQQQLEYYAKRQDQDLERRRKSQEMDLQIEEQRKQMRLKYENR